MNQHAEVTGLLPTSCGSEMSDHLKSGAATNELLLENARLRSKLDQLTYGEGDDGNGCYFTDKLIEQMTLTQENVYFSESCEWESSESLTIGDLIAPRFKPLDLAMATDDEVEQSLRVLIKELVDVGQYIVHAGHLSDRRLYCLIVKDVLTMYAREIENPSVSYWFCCFHTDNSFLENDDSLWLSYYADDSQRLEWARSHRGQPLPPKLVPPHVRDYMPPPPDFSLN